MTTTTVPDARDAPEQLLWMEWQRPWITGLYASAACGILAAIGLGLSVATGAPLDKGDLIIFASMTAFGSFVALVSTRRIRLRPDVLSIGGKQIPLAAVTETRILRGRELWRVRNRLAMPSSRATPLLLGNLVPGIGQAFAGGYLFATRTIRAGNCCSPGQGPAVALLTPSLPTPLWIVGSRRAEELKETIDRARAALPTQSDPQEESGWLPPPREH